MSTILVLAVRPDLGRTTRPQATLPPAGLQVPERLRARRPYRTVLHRIGSRGCWVVGTCGTVGTNFGLNCRVSRRARSRQLGGGVSVLGLVGDQGRGGRTAEKTLWDMA
jgi:hypothetical protein